MDGPLAASISSRLLGFLAVLIVAYLAILSLARIFEKRFIFFPNYPGRLVGDWRPEGLPVEDVWFEAADGVRLHGWWIPGAGAEFTFVAFHGNAANITNRAEVYRFLWQLPANVLAVEYRGYGRSEGSPSEEGLYLDAEAAYDYLAKQRGVSPRQMVPFGQSLGTAVAVDLATRREVAGVVLEAPFASVRSVAWRTHPFLPGLGWVVRTKFDTAEKLARIAAPKLIVHCTGDPVIAFPLGEQVYRAAREPKVFLRIVGGCHEEASLVAGEQYRTKLIEFLAVLKSG